MTILLALSECPHSPQNASVTAFCAPQLEQDTIYRQLLDYVFGLKGLVFIITTIQGPMIISTKANHINEQSIEQ